MGTKGISIVGMDVVELLGLLNKSSCDEWLAYYQYWIGAKVVKGPMKEAVIAELEQHATEELNHALLLSKRIIQLGGTPATSPEQWSELTNCGDEAPNSPFVETILKQNIKGEQCAIDVYQSLMQKTISADPVTHTILLQSLEQEVDHEEDLQTLLEDFELL